MVEGAPFSVKAAKASILAGMDLGCAQGLIEASRLHVAAYASLDARRQKYIADWVGRFNGLTGLQAQPEPFYDSKVKLSAKTTFDAVTNALMTTTLTERSGAAHGDALSLVDRSIVGTPISISTIDRPVFRPDFSTGI